jgi:hypothetical protein
MGWPANGLAVRTCFGLDGRRVRRGWFTELRNMYSAPSSLHRIISCVLLCLGTVMLIYGFNAIDSLSSSLSRIFTGTPTDKVLWLMLTGIILFGAGLGGLARGPKTH